LARLTGRPDPFILRLPCKRKQRGYLKRAPTLFICSFLFVRPKRNEPKKKGAGNDNFSLFWQNAFGLTLPKKAEVRTISGLPPHLPPEIIINKRCIVLKEVFTQIGLLLVDNKIITLKEAYLDSTEIISQ